MKETVGFLYAHPDDETFLSACLIRQLADDGYDPALLLATYGDAGKKNGHAAHFSNEALAELRRSEMDKAAAILGAAAVDYLGYPDGELNEVDEELFLEGVVQFLNKYRPKIVFTFPENGGNYHPDHIAISRMATAAVLSGRCPSVQKLYYAASDIGESARKPTIAVDTEPQWELKAEALRAHHSQIFAIERFFGDLTAFPENRRYEAFVLRWERGEDWPVKAERTIFDDLQH
jgi:LmbE family N-acetylglucosaminyl deacetylase